MVLTVEATEVTTRTGEGETRGAGMEMVEGLLLDGVDGKGTGTAVDLADEHTVLIPAAAAHTRLAVSNMAVVGAELTLDCPILQLAIISTLETIH